MSIEVTLAEKIEIIWCNNQTPPDRCRRETSELFARLMELSWYTWTSKSISNRRMRVKSAESQIQKSFRNYWYEALCTKIRFYKTKVLWLYPGEDLFRFCNKSFSECKIILITVVNSFIRKVKACFCQGFAFSFATPFNSSRTFKQKVSWQIAKDKMIFQYPCRLVVSRFPHVLIFSWDFHDNIPQPYFQALIVAIYC